MANPAKRKVDGSGTGSDPTDGDDTPAAPVVSKRVTPPKAKAAQAKAAAQSTRYTAPSVTSHRGPSPRWVPILMFGLWGLGLLVIVLNYMGVMPGTGDDGSGWYLIGGLLAILAGIMVATQYR